MTATDTVRVAAIAAGVLATLVPAGVAALGWSETRVHGDLWITLPLFVVAAFVVAGSRPLARSAAIAIRVLGALALVAALINGIAIQRRLAHAGEGHLEAWLAAQSRVHLACYACVALAGLVLVCLPRRVAGAAGPGA